MKLAGVDGVIDDWYGAVHFYELLAINNQATVELFQIARRAGLKFAVCYEDQTIQHEIDDHFLKPGEGLAHAQQEMLYLQTNFFADPCYLRLHDRPVLLNFGPQHFLDSSNWDEIFSVLDASNRPAFFTEDNRLSSGTKQLRFNRPCALDEPGSRAQAFSPPPPSKSTSPTR